jgi:hypothetical protein
MNEPPVHTVCPNTTLSGQVTLPEDISSCGWHVLERMQLSPPSHTVFPHLLPAAHPCAGQGQVPLCCCLSFLKGDSCTLHHPLSTQQPGQSLKPLDRNTSFFSSLSGSSSSMRSTVPITVKPHTLGAQHLITTCPPSNSLFPSLRPFVIPKTCQS